ncbi:4-hydroxythreonine-4-phosphate dehydrogenase PdxA [Planctomycetales bacterium 10988]|nr:4-hydroxythreonine-4-phosphate dehydrogenase PdxA [Planctomycetales bacterium 10988]
MSSFPSSTSEKSSSNASLPWLALTMGDPAGVGPEILVRCWQDPAFHQMGNLLAVGHPEIFRQAAHLFAPGLRVVEVSDPHEIQPSCEMMPCLGIGLDADFTFEPKQVSAAGGEVAYRALVRAAELAQSGEVQAITTAPLCKESLHAAGHFYPGHTELLAELCGIEEVAMMLYLAPDELVKAPAGLGIAHVTLHTAMRNIFDQLTQEAIAAKIQLTHQVMHWLKGSAPRIGVAALNPHGGENGLFGEEEIQQIQPAVTAMQSQGINVQGPFPTDTLIYSAAREGTYDGLVAMYHDQGHIALKLLGFHRAVNITLGLPIVRTSVAHGTAFDLAWQGKAELNSLREAVRVAVILANCRAAERLQLAKTP